MSNEGFKFQASVKDADGDMVNVRADSAEELGAYLSSFPVAEYAQFKANVRGGAALGGITAPAQAQPQAPVQQQEQAPSWATSQPQQAAPQQSQGWGAAAQQAPQQQAAPQGGNGQCQCGQPLEFKTTGSGKGVYRCPQWRWNNGNPTSNHDQAWAS